jgi:hypothetical protein
LDSKGKKKREKGDKEKLATSGLKYLEHPIWHRPCAPWPCYTCWVAVTACSADAIGGWAHMWRAHVVVAWRRTRLAIALYAPLSPARLSALESSLSFPYWTPPSRSFSGRHVARTPPWRANPIPSFLLFPTRTSLGSVPWRCCSPPRVPLVIPLHAASVLGALRHHLRPPDYKCHLACLPSIPPPDLKPLEAELRDPAVVLQARLAPRLRSKRN